MKIGYKDFWIEIDPTIQQIKSALEFIWRILNMSIPFWFLIILLIILYVLIWRQRVFNWKTQKGMLKLWAWVRGLKVEELRKTGVSDNETQELMKTLDINRFDGIFSWKPPKNDSPRFLPKLWRRR